MQRLDINRNGINGWYCKSCGIYNDILTIQCAYGCEVRDSSLAAISDQVRFRRMGMNMSQNERELHADFFTQWNAEAERDIATLNDADLTVWIRELEKIALEAKVKIIKGNEAVRQRKAKNRPWLVESTDVEVNESIKTVKTRKERMSRLDKLGAELADIMGVEDSAGIIKDLAAKQGMSVTTTSDRIIQDKREPAISLVKTNTNTQESLLADLSESITKGIEDRPIDDLVNATKTAAHIGNKILNKRNESVKDEPFDFSKLSK